jgi:alpha-1,2-mannosyltransferase
MTAPLSFGAWLTPDRATAWCRVLAVGELAWVAAQIAAASGAKTLMQTDFTCYWAAASLAVHDAPASVYDLVKIAAAEHGLQHVAADLFEPFMYPPSFLLLLVPLAFLPPIAALLCFTAAGVMAFLVCIRRILAEKASWLAMLAFPGLLVTANTGQNGLLTASCFGGGALLLDETPFLAGLCLGLLTCKPQLGVLVPVALVSARRWRALAGAAVSAIMLAALSALVLGGAVWRAFLETASASRRVLTGGLSDPSQLQSVFGAARILHAPQISGAMCQAAMSLAAVLLLVRVARRRPGGQAEMAVLVAATLAGTPYLMDYDLAALAIPLAWLFVAANRGAWRAWEKYAAMAAYMMPLLTRGIAKSFGVPLAPFILTGFAAVIIGRAAHSGSMVGTREPACVQA